MNKNQQTAFCNIQERKDCFFQFYQDVRTCKSKTNICKNKYFFSFLFMNPTLANAKRTCLIKIGYQIRLGLTSYHWCNDDLVANFHHFIGFVYITRYTRYICIRNLPSRRRIQKRPCHHLTSCLSFWNILKSQNDQPKVLKKTF